MTEDGPDPDLLARLESLRPRDELVQRIALREQHDALRDDPLFKERIKFLLEMLNPPPGDMAAIMAEARAVQRGEALPQASTRAEETPPALPRRPPRRRR
jgi:hypothetical protein